jgi:hypothetical protein
VLHLYALLAVLSRRPPSIPTPTSTPDPTPDVMSQGDSRFVIAGIIALTIIVIWSIIILTRPKKG